VTINVSVRVPDGIIVASDSLASSVLPVHQQIQVAMKCGNCGHDSPPGVFNTPPIGLPGNSTPLATKLFYVGNHGLAFFGASAINGRSLFNHVMVFRTTIYKDSMQIGDVADGIAKMLNDAIKVDRNLQAQVPAGQRLGGFQVSGYDKGDIDVGRTAVVEYFVGKDPARVDHQDHNLTVTGDDRVVNMLFSKTAHPNFGRMTIPDAIDYARFLVQTTSDYHRFSDKVPTVGGPTEIALITKWIGFRWVDRKKILDSDTTRLNIGKIASDIGGMRRDLPELIRGAKRPAAADAGGEQAGDVIPYAMQDAHN
jgi:hypothetical protein